MGSKYRKDIDQLLIQEMWRLRKRLQWSQAKLGAYCGCNKQRINNVELGKERPSQRIREKFAMLLVEDLLEMRVYRPNY